MIDPRSLQSALAAAKFYKGKIDGDFGPASIAARAALLTSLSLPHADWPQSRKVVALEQWIMAEAGIEIGAIDGLPGPAYRFGLEQWQNHLRDLTPKDAAIAHQPTIWPRQKDMATFYGEPGENHTLLTLPYPMRLAWDPGVSVKKITINAKCAESASRALAKAKDVMGYEQIRRLRLDLFGGCFNNRKMRGGSSLSTHAFACALDIDPERNQLRWGSDRAAMAKKECAPFLDAFEAEGWISLGRERNFDWMHIQAARL